MSYRAGVLIHNYNEDRYGQDLLRIQKQPDAPWISVAHTVHNWKDSDREKPEQTVATQHVDRHILFGHSGDMRDPNEALQKTEFLTNQTYFIRDPKKVAAFAATRGGNESFSAGVSALTADKYAAGEVDPDVGGAHHTSYIADKRRAGWGNGSSSHALRSSDRFKTTYGAELEGDYLQKMGSSDASRIPRPKGDCTRYMDKVQVTRDVGRIRSLQSASTVALKSK